MLMVDALWSGLFYTPSISNVTLLRVTVRPRAGISHSDCWNTPRQTTNENGASTFAEMASPLTVRKCLSY